MGRRRVQRKLCYPIHEGFGTRTRGGMTGKGFMYGTTMMLPMIPSSRCIFDQWRHGEQQHDLIDLSYQQPAYQYMKWDVWWSIASVRNRAAKHIRFPSWKTNTSCPPSVSLLLLLMFHILSHDRSQLAHDTSKQRQSNAFEGSNWDAYYSSWSMPADLNSTTSRRQVGYTRRISMPSAKV